MARRKTAKVSKAAREQRFRLEVYEWIHCLIIALVVCVITFVFFIRIIDVSGTSMNPTLNNGDKMLVSNVLYKPKAGDIVVFKKDSYDPNKALVKRVIATEGQVININFETGAVFVDGVELKEDYIRDLTYNKLDFIGPQTVPEGCVFVMGDHRNNSTDSRRFGEISVESILGKVLLRVYPLRDFGAPAPLPEKKEERGSYGS